MRSKNCSATLAILVASFFMISCAQPTEQVIETGSVSKFSQLDQDFCTAFLEQINPESLGEDRSKLRLIAANHWVIVDDEVLTMSLRDLQNMNFDRYQIIAADGFRDSPVISQSTQTIRSFPLDKKSPISIIYNQPGKQVYL